MSVVQVNYTFGGRAHGSALFTTDDLEGIDIDDPMAEDNIVELVKRTVWADMSTGIEITNLESVVDWAKRKLRHETG